MKFKEALDRSKIVHQDKIEKLFDDKTASLLLKLEETIQDFWNVDRPSANFLNLLIQMKNVQSALEIGTSNGYSSIWLAKALKKTKGRLVTLEYWQKRMDLALENFKQANVDDIITPIVGDAIEILDDMNKNHSMEFDFIFVDANKAEYIQYFNSFDSLLKKGGVIVADNILSHYKKTKDYVETLLNHPDYQSQLLDFDAGMLLSYKINKKLWLINFYNIFCKHVIDIF